MISRRTALDLAVAVQELETANSKYSDCAKTQVSVPKYMSLLMTEKMISNVTKKMQDNLDAEMKCIAEYIKCCEEDVVRLSEKARVELAQDIQTRPVLDVDSVEEKMQYIRRWVHLLSEEDKVEILTGVRSNSKM